MVRYSLQREAIQRPIGGILLLAVVTCCCQSGCVQRRMMIRTDPPGALAYVDDYEIGTTPIATNFTYYGTRKIRLVKDGRETKTVMQPLAMPWYQIPPLDFISENLVPVTIHDQHEFEYKLSPQVIVPPEQLLGQAEQLRRGVQTEAGVPPGPARPRATAPQPAGPPAGGVAPGVGSQPLYPLPSQ